MKSTRVMQEPSGPVRSSFGRGLNTMIKLFYLDLLQHGLAFQETKAVRFYRRKKRLETLEHQELQTSDSLCH